MFTTVYMSVYILCEVKKRSLIMCIADCVELSRREVKYNQFFVILNTKYISSHLTEGASRDRRSQLLSGSSSQN